MSISGEYELRAHQLQDLLARARTETPTATARALNRSAVSVRAAMASAVKADVGALKVGAVKDKIEIREANPGPRPEASLRVSKRRIALMAFGARQFSYGVRARLKGGADRIPGAFVATMPSGHTGVFKRRGRARLHIDERFGPSLARPFARLWPDVGRRKFVEVLPKNLRSESRFLARSRA